MRLPAAFFGLLAVLASYFTCTKASTPQDGAIYAAVISAALDRNDVLRETVVYVIPSVERRVDTHSVEETLLSPDMQDAILKNLERLVRFADPEPGDGVRITLGPVEEIGDQRRVQVRLLEGAAGRGSVATYVLERREGRWRVVQTTPEGTVLPSATELSLGTE